MKRHDYVRYKLVTNTEPSSLDTASRTSGIAFLIMKLYHDLYNSENVIISICSVAHLLSCKCHSIIVYEHLKLKQLQNHCLTSRCFKF